MSGHPSWPTGDVHSVAKELRTSRSLDPEMWAFRCDLLGMPMTDVDAFIDAVLGGAS